MPEQKESTSQRVKCIALEMGLTVEEVSEKSLTFTHPEAWDMQTAELVIQAFRERVRRVLRGEDDNGRS